VHKCVFCSLQLPSHITRQQQASSFTRQLPSRETIMMSTRQQQALRFQEMLDLGPSDVPSVMESDGSLRFCVPKSVIYHNPAIASFFYEPVELPQKLMMRLRSEQWMRDTLKQNGYLLH
jgi:hypothetical protein